MGKKTIEPSIPSAPRPARLHPALSFFPAMSEENLTRVSVDAQFYARCAACGFEERYHPDQQDEPTQPKRRSKKKSKQKSPPAAAPCMGCGKRAARPAIQHLMCDRGHCRDCNTTFEIHSGPWEILRCPACGSQELEVEETGVEPPFPLQFGERDNMAWLPARLSKEEGHIWGTDGIDDAHRVKAEGDMWAHFPNMHSIVYGVMLFAERLRTYCDYKDAMERYLIANIEANLAQNVFRANGWMFGAQSALQLFEWMIDIAPDAANRGLAQHSFAMMAFSLFAKLGVKDTEAALDWAELRETALERAQAAERTFQEDPEVASIPGAEIQVARIRWVLGDLVSVGSSTDAERRRAIAYFDQALANESLAHNVGFALRASRGRTLAALDKPQDDDLLQAVEDLRSAMEDESNDKAYADRWRQGYTLSKLLLKHGMWQEALPFFQRTASFAWQQFQALIDEQQLAFKSEQIANVFEGLAALYASLGWSDEALSLIEITRCSSVRLYTMDVAERDRLAKADQAKLLESLHPARLRAAGIPDLHGRPSAMHIDDILAELAIGTEVLAVLSSRKEIATGLLTILADQDTLTALLCTSATAPKKPKKPGWKIERAQWKLTSQQLDALMGQSHLEGGPFRERLIGKLCRAGGEYLLRPLMEMLRSSAVSRLRVSLPGSMTGLPLEAFSDESEQPLLPGLGISVSYLPSIRLGSDLLDHQRAVRGDAVSNTKRARKRSVLFIGYGGDDLDVSRLEHENVAAACQSQTLTYLPGSEATKQRVLEALRGKHDIIHIQAHGTFNAARPLSSALHFVPDLDDDSRRITAFDLLNEVRFTRAPLIVLSACSSAITLGWRTGTYQGLLGSLLRVGAAGLIGSRWPVGDAATAHFMSRLYSTLRDPAVLPERALHAVSNALRADGAPREQWAAFGYFGIS
jgi:hypothetical protein